MGVTAGKILYGLFAETFWLGVGAGVGALGIPTGCLIGRIDREEVEKKEHLTHDEDPKDRLSFLMFSTVPTFAAVSGIVASSCLVLGASFNTRALACSSVNLCLLAALSGYCASYYK
eukprot:TRINITY_DN27785_c0_g1_i1.p1 TRINITY_DN27785_c0_g1~~TRINITY_DN27785_c0_g1_i1.p1  ORF type:complete len:117 (+),score=18.00 TRINITY_DN27785_c0_g1_i1:100-450(+)